MLIGNYKENYKSAAFARFKYIDIDKNDLIKNIKINDELVNTLYEKYREDGLYSKPISYKVNHILITKNAENYESMAEEALTSIKNGLRKLISVARTPRRAYLSR